MPSKTPVAVSDEDIRRKYYETAGYTNWIQEMQLDPLQLVVCDDATGKHFRVPVELKGGDFTFGDPVEVNVQYIDSTKSKASAAIVWASRDDSLAGMTVATGQPAAAPKVDYEALARMVEEDARVSAPGLKVSPAQAAAVMHAAALRAQARSDSPDTASVSGPSHTEGAVNMPFDRDKIREALGLGPDATDAQITEAWASAWPSGVPSTAPAPTPPAESGTNLNGLAELAKRQGVILMDPAQVDEMKAMAARGQQAYNAQRASERDGVIDKACESGRIALSRKEDWVKAWDAEVKLGGDGSKTRELIESLTPNLVPMEAQGYASAAASNETDVRYYGLYPEDKPSVGGRRG